MGADQAFTVYAGIAHSFLGLRFVRLQIAAQPAAASPSPSTPSRAKHQWPERASALPACSWQLSVQASAEGRKSSHVKSCLLYTSDAADDM
eukprot:2342223-Alexandrium_andersonii.AAC.1